MEKKMKLKQCIADIPSLSRRLFIVIIMMVLCFLQTNASELINGLYYTLYSSSKTAAIVNSTLNQEENVIIPSSIEYNGQTYQVTTISDNVFRYAKMKSVTIPESVKRIGNEAFYYCSNLTSIEIGKNVTSIGNDSFGYCTALTSIKVSEDNPIYDSRDNCNAIIRTSDNTLLYGCLNSFIPDGIVKIQSSAFSHLKIEGDFVVPESVTSIGDEAFCYCTELTSIKLPSKLSSFGHTVFWGCSKIKSISIPEGVKEIGEYSFCECRGLEKVSLPTTIKTIGFVAFQHCTNLTDINLPNGIESIGNSAFYSCESLTEIELPSSITSIGNGAFEYCYNLKSIFIPKNLTSIGNCAFSFCKGLKSLSVDPNNPVYDSRNNCNAIVRSEDNTILFGSGSTVFDESITSIGDYAFWGNNLIVEIYIPNTISSIGIGAFRDCINLKKVSIPNSITTINDYAFERCSNLEVLDWHDGITNIGKYCFSNCSSLNDIKLPESIEKISFSCLFGCVGLSKLTLPKKISGIEKWALYGCTGLKEITCEAINPPLIEAQEAINNIDLSIPVYVPAASIEAYKSADYWSEFTNFQAIVEEEKTEWRISDRTDIEVDFHSIEEAMEDERVQNGHTLYIERGTNLGNAEITKSVNVIGPGYDLADDSRNAKVDFMIINAENTKVVGLQVQNVLVCNNNVNIENCYITSSVLGNETSYENDNCVIKSCFIDGNVEGRGEDGTQEWTLTNNIIKGGVYYFVEMTLNHNTIVSDNYVLNRVNISMVTNNVLFRPKNVSPISDCTDNEYNKNIVSAISGTNGEEWCETLSKIISCTGDASSEDYYTPVGYSLGYSTDGTDCGAFGGSELYVKGGKSGLFVEREGEGCDEPEPEPEPTYPETPIVKGKLDNTATLDIVNDVYNSLGEFLKALSIRGINTGTEIEVANQQFDIALDDESYGYIQTSAVALEMTKAYIYMKASNNAIFNITLSPTFAATHASEVQTVLATIMGFANHIITTNIKILINGTQYQYTGFQVEPNDLLNLKNMYNAMGGEKWSSKWSFLSNGRQTTDFPGVTFTTADEMGYSRVQEIDLSKNNLSGDISSLALNFPKLTTINLYGNSLTGDATEMVRGLSSLKSLNISYNLLTGLTSLPSSVSSLSKGGQLTGASTEYIESLNAITVFISDKQEVKLPTIMTYDLATNSNVPVKMFIKERDNTYSNTYYGTLAPYNSTDFIYATKWVNDPYTYEYAQDHEIYLRTTDGTIYPAILKYETGDANMSGYTNLDDVQTTISKVLSPSVVSLFNTTAANTYNDETINVQDVVCTVNIVLGKPIVFIEIPTETGNHYDQPLLASRRATPVPGGTGNILFVKGERLWLTNETEVGAIEVELRGLQADEVSLALNRKDFQMASLDIEGRSRHIIYSLSGKSVPVGTAAILRLSSDYAEVADAALSSVDAKSLSFTIGVTPTAINTVDSGDMLKARFEGNNIVISSSRKISNAEVIVTSASGVNALTWQGKYVNAGETMIEADLASGIYIIGIYENGKRIGNAKLIKK